MLSSKLFVLMMIVVSMILFSAPAAEGTFLVLACLLRSPLCPFRTTTTTTSTTTAATT
ncbi:uncharacterized protein LOC133336400 [Musca vetustissima]|uniref:uncharacterized protein LOC133336400 n=1 Tax=Musca vetustissima TaxID=27455 RepID=UPI002AB6E80F|nr:uncharacterized protein LOC133336400 [Musca vetustissima]